MRATLVGGTCECACVGVRASGVGACACMYVRGRVYARACFCVRERVNV